MPRARQNVPDELNGIPLRTQHAREIGISASRMRREDVGRPFTGVVGFGLDLSGDDDELHLSVRFPRTPPRGIGVRGHSLRRIETRLLAGLPVASPAFSWCQAAATLRREDLVAAGDALLTGPRIGGVRGPGVVAIDELARAAERLRGSPGSARVAWALPRLRAGVDSRPESLLRLVCVRATASLSLAWITPSRSGAASSCMRTSRGRAHASRSSTRATSLFPHPTALMSRLRRLLAERTPENRARSSK